ncbi:MAG: lipoprotein signal peptidase [Flavobacteriaceae bacterium]|nr:lipoprotein signal peptidase [Flavobacteriaceae bacterium]
MKKAAIIIILILLIDQISKIYIKTHFVLSEEIKVFGLDWFRIHFLENNGMAWGKEFGGRSGKLFLTLFRLVAISGIGYWLYGAIKSNSHKILIVAISFIFAGALGNIIDSIFYGIFFDNSYRQVATFLPPEGGYDSLFHGKVVDMLYFPMVDAMLPDWLPSMSFSIPDWLPIIGGNNYSFFVNRHFTFFDPVFNVADTAISTGVAMLIVFNKKVFPHKTEEKEL